MFCFRYNNMEVFHRLVEKPMEDVSEEYESHYHEHCIDIYIVTSGSFKVVAENSQKILESGEAAVIMPDSLHRIEAVDDSPYEIICFRLPSIFISKNIEERLKARGVFYEWPDMSQIGRVDSLYENRSDEEGSDELLYMQYGVMVSSVLIYLCRTESAAKSSAVNVLGAQVQEYIDANIFKKITMADLCEKFHRSSSYISKQFRMHTGVPVITYVREKKIALAQTMIETSSKPVDTARELGFTDYATFYKTYMSVKGTSPTDKNRGRK